MQVPAAPETLPIARDVPPPKRMPSPPGTLVAGVILTAILGVVAAAGPWLVPYNPDQLDLPAALQPPGARHWFGTDQYGRDIFSRVIAAARTDLLIALAIVGIALAAGTAIGILAGYAGGWADTVIMRVTDVALAFPFVVLVVAVAAARGPGTANLILAASLVWWVAYARLARGQALQAREMPWMDAARVAGASPVRRIMRHLLPNTATQLLVYASSDIVYAVLLTSAVSFLGAGVQPPAPEWGQMIYAAEDYMTTAWWLAVFPGLAIVFTGIAFSLLGDGFASVTS
jgi:peptide/nickel transport system permease protein